MVAVLVIGGCEAGGRNDGVDSGVEQGSVEWNIENAMSAAPEAIARGATIMGWPTGPGASPTVLREGTNGWVRAHRDLYIMPVSGGIPRLLHASIEPNRTIDFPSWTNEGRIVFSRRDKSGDLFLLQGEGQ